MFGCMRTIHHQADANLENNFEIKYIHYIIIYKNYIFTFFVA